MAPASGDARAVKLEGRFLGEGFVAKLESLFDLCYDQISMWMNAWTPKLLMSPRDY